MKTLQPGGFSKFLRSWADNIFYKQTIMLKHFLSLFSVLLLFSFSATAQKLKKADRATLERLQQHVIFLADDKLEGRRPGTEGEKMAMEYIKNSFAQSGLQPKGVNGSWFQEFEIYDGKFPSPSTHLIINDRDLKLNEDFFPLSFSPNTSGKAIVAMVLQEQDVPWFFNINDLIEKNSHNPHFDLMASIKDIAKEAAEKKASAVIFYNSGNKENPVKYEKNDRGENSAIPVFYMSSAAAAKYLNDESAMLDIKFKTDIQPVYRKGHNVIGFIDNNASNTVVLGAHFDHLGYGEDQNSRDSLKHIHNGADDNASGTAALMEIAHLLSKSKNKKSNYLFIAFSAEELGLFGSKYFVDNPTIDLSNVNYMINMDMIGRLNNENGLTVGGYGTSPAWNKVFNNIKTAKDFNLKYDSSGTGPSDHTSFYRKDIPVLFFFTGLHNDYHKTTDDADKINFTGQTLIVKMIMELLEETSSMPKLEFTPTAERQTSTSARFSVGLGIMPDYTFTGQGVRADGVTAGRAAAKAGVQAGDILLKIGDFDTHNLEAYMQALAKFKKGDSTRIVYKRGEEIIEANVEF